MRRKKELAILLTVASLQIVAPITVHAAQEELKASPETTSISTESVALTESIASTQEDSIQANEAIESTESEKAQSEENTNASDEQKEENSSETNSLDEETSEDISSEEAVSNEDSSEEEQQNNQISEAANEKQEEENTAASEAEKMESGENLSQVDNSENNEAISQSEDSQQTDADIQTAETNSDANSVSAKANSILADEEPEDSESDNANGQKNGWVTENGEAYYYTNGEKVKNKVLSDNGNIFGFDYSGKMMKNREYSFYDSSTSTRNTYYFDENGHAIDGWKDSTYYFDPTTKIAVKGKNVIDGKIYFFDFDGRLLKDQTKADESDNTIYYLDHNGTAIQQIDVSKDGWHQINGVWYYTKNKSLLKNQVETINGNIYGFDENGAMIAGRDTYISNQHYIFNDNGTAVKGWYQDTQGAWFYTDPLTATPANGRRSINGKNYYFSDGQMETDYIDYENDNVYYFNANGILSETKKRPENGWLQINKNWYYYEDGSRIEDQIREINGYQYYFDDSGIMLTNQEHEDFYNGRKYGFRLDADGHFIKGWYQDSYGDWYYYGKDGYGVREIQEINGVNYFFSDAGQLLTNFNHYTDDGTYVITDEKGQIKETLSTASDGWKKFNGSWYLVQNHAFVTDKWVKSGNDWYYFSYDGRAYNDGINIIDDQTYYFEEDGTLLSGWKKVYESVLHGWKKPYSGRWIYADPNGHLALGLKKIGNHTYYFNDDPWSEFARYKMLTNTKVVAEDGTLYDISSSGEATLQDNANGWIKIGADYYLFSNGKAQKGWRLEKGKWYYLGTDTTEPDCYKMVYSTTMTIDGKSYSFDSNGALITNAPVELYSTVTWNGFVHDQDGGRVTTGYIDQNGNESNTGWVSSNGKWYYFKNGKAITGTSEVDGKYSNFDESGVWLGYLSEIPTGWYLNPSTKQYYYFGQDHKILKNTEFYNGGNYYRFDENGIMLSDIEYQNQYYRSDGVRLSSSWREDNFGRWFYYDASGNKVSGFHRINGSLYFLNSHYGIAMTDFIYDDTLYFVNQDNGVITGSTRIPSAGWIRASGTYYYYDGNKLVKDEIRTINGKKYCFGSNGSMLADMISKENSGTYHYYKIDGSMLIDGWYKDDQGTWYYADRNGNLAEGLVTINGVKYYFGNDELIFDKKWYMRTSNSFSGDRKTLYVINSSGVVTDIKSAPSKDGWVSVSGKWYYAQNGQFARNDWIDIDGKKYAIDVDGTLVTNDVFDGSMVDANGVKTDDNYTRIKNSSGDYYYLKDANLMDGDIEWQGKHYWTNSDDTVYVGIADTGRGYYYYDGKGGRKKLTLTEGWNGQENSWMYVKNGKILTGFQTVNGKKYAFNSEGILNYNSFIYFDGENEIGYAKDDGTAATGWTKINNTWYYFNEDGLAVCDCAASIEGKTSYFDMHGRWKGYI